MGKLFLVYAQFLLLSGTYLGRKKGGYVHFFSLFSILRPTLTPALILIFPFHFYTVNLTMKLHYSIS